MILHIDTATSIATVSLAEQGSVIDSLVNQNQKDHASFIHPAISRLLEKAAIKVVGLEAVAVTNGPGSYTGLRVGMATAKGLCYAANIPLITLGTLEAMAQTAILQMTSPGFICPMIDARRMEVYTAVYDTQRKEMISPCALVLEGAPFGEFEPLWFTGSGVAKLEGMAAERILGKQDLISPEALALLALEKFKKGEFADIAYSTPIYLKEFYTPVPPRGRV